MNKEEKLKRICDNFSVLSEDQQDYVLGILQALVFANSSFNNNQSGQIEADNSNNDS